MKFALKTVKRIEDAIDNGKVTSRQLETLAMVDEAPTSLFDRVMAIIRNAQAMSKDLGGGYEPLESDDSYALKVAQKAAGSWVKCITDYHEDVVSHFARRALIRKARKAGLNRPEMFCGKIAPQAYVAWENACLRLMPERCMLSTNGDKPRWGYDSMGTWGVNGHDLQKAWFVSGCKDSSKYRTILSLVAQWLKSRGRIDDERISSFLRAIQPKHSRQQVIWLWRGICTAYSHQIWVRSGRCDHYHKGNQDWFNTMGSKKLITLGRVSKPMALAMLQGYKSTGKLNLELADQIQKGGNVVEILGYETVLNNQARDWAKPWVPIAQSAMAEAIGIQNARVMNCATIMELAQVVLDGQPTPMGYAKHQVKNLSPFRVKIGCTVFTLHQLKAIALGGGSHELDLNYASAIVRFAESQERRMAEAA